MELRTAEYVTRYATLTRTPLQAQPPPGGVENRLKEFTEEDERAPAV
jgi:hypothetical protein